MSEVCINLMYSLSFQTDACIMMATQESTPVVTLPDLHTRSRQTTVPRRYEETKPALVQGFTHHRILSMFIS